MATTTYDSEIVSVQIRFDGVLANLVGKEHACLGQKVVDRVGKIVAEYVAKRGHRLVRFQASRHTLDEWPWTATVAAAVAVFVIDEKQTLTLLNFHVQAWTSELEHDHRGCC